MSKTVANSEVKVANKKSSRKAKAEPQVEEDFSAAFEDVDLSPAGFDTDNFSPMGNEENPESHDDFDSSFSDFDLVPPEVPHNGLRGILFGIGQYSRRTWDPALSQCK